MIIVTEATKGKSKKQFQHGVRIGFFSATVPKKKKCKKAKWLSKEALQIAEEGREAKSKGERERTPN